MYNRWSPRIAIALAALWAAPVAAQDTWSNYAVMTGQSEVLNEMNRDNAKRVHKENGLPPPDFDAAALRLAARDAARRPAGTRMSAGERAQKCAIVRANIARLTPDQVAKFRKLCG